MAEYECTRGINGRKVSRLWLKRETIFRKSSWCVCNGPSYLYDKNDEEVLMTTRRRSTIRAIVEFEGLKAKKKAKNRLLAMLFYCFGFIRQCSHVWTSIPLRALAVLVVC
jgi:hypothetical protein